MQTYYPPIDHAVPDVSGLSWPFPFPRPQPIKINGVLLVGDKSSEELGLASAEDMKQVQQEVSGMGEQITRAVEAAQTATQTANEAKEEAARKADADDLPYALTEAEATARLPADVTVWTYVDGAPGVNVTSLSVIILYRNEERWWELKVGDQPIAFWLNYGEYLQLEDEYAYMGFCLCDSSGNLIPEDVRLPNLILLPPILTNRAINLVTATVGATSIPLTLPEEVSGHSRDLYVRIDLSEWSGGDVPLVSFQNSDGSLPVTEAKGGTWPSLVAGKGNLISLKEVAAGVFTVEAAAYERISPPTP